MTAQPIDTEISQRPLETQALSADLGTSDTHELFTVAGPTAGVSGPEPWITTLSDHSVCVAQHDSVAESTTRPAAATALPIPRDSSRRLDDPLLYLLAASVDDLEAARTAAENRLRQLTRTGPDKDGEERGFELDDNVPAVGAQRAIVTALEDAEHQAILGLQRRIREHALGPWIKAHVGVGEKQAARLLAAIGDPYWNTLHDRPRTVSELWAYSGLHTLPVGHIESDAQVRRAGGELSAGSDIGHTRCDAPDSSANVAARRQRGHKTNWSTEAKTRVYLIAETCMKNTGGARGAVIARRSPYRDVYEQRRTATAERTHATPCIRCGPSGHPAPAGTPWSDAHKNADALRIVSKRILRDLWRAARDIHQETTP